MSPVPVAPALAALQPLSPGEALIADPAIAASAASALARLSGVDDRPAGREAAKGAAPDGLKTITIFFDPRCPHCHAAFKALHGRFALRWIPVNALSDAAAAEPSILPLLLAANQDRLAAIEAAIAGGTASAQPGADLIKAAPEKIEAARAAMRQNLEALASFFAAAARTASPLAPGVPTLFVPRPDGGLAVMIGWDEGDETKLARLTGEAATASAPAPVPGSAPGSAP